MRKFVLSFFSCLFLVISSCHQREPIYCQLADELMVPYSQKLAREEGLFMDGWGGAMMYDIEKFNMSYISEKKMKLEEARLLFVKILEGFRNIVNADEKIRPYLHNYPIDEKNFDLWLSFESKDGEFAPNDYITFIFLLNGKIYYDSYDHKKGKFINIYQEPYSEALRIFQKNQILDSKSPG